MAARQPRKHHREAQEGLRPRVPLLFRTVPNPGLGASWEPPRSDARAYDAGASFRGSTGTPKELERLERELGERPELLARRTP